MIAGPVGPVEVFFYWSEAVSKFTRIYGIPDADPFILGRKYIRYHVGILISGSYL